jgi:hypothetical protein
MRKDRETDPPPAGRIRDRIEAAFLAILFAVLIELAKVIIH